MKFLPKRFRESHLLAAGTSFTQPLGYKYAPQSTLLCPSGQPKQFFCRNTETETRPLQEAEILPDTNILADTLFRPEETVSALVFMTEMCYLSRLIWPKHRHWKTEIPKPKPKQEPNRNLFRLTTDCKLVFQYREITWTSSRPTP